MAVFLYRLKQSYSYVHPVLNDVSFANQWVDITNGCITIKKNYAWDGCTPKWQPLGLLTIGTPDGVLRFGKPWLYHSSLIHDVLVQFRKELPFTQQQVTQIFKEHMQQTKWPLWRIYTAAVNYLGPQDFK